MGRSINLYWPGIVIHDFSVTWLQTSAFSIYLVRSVSGVREQRIGTVIGEVQSLVRS